MANPSTGFGGAGTEVLRRGYVHAMTNSNATLITGVANHIYTVLSIIFVGQATNTEAISMWIDADLGGTNIFLLSSQVLVNENCFVWNDRFVITETDKLVAKTGSAANIDVWISYIDQQLA